MNHLTQLTKLQISGLSLEETNIMLVDYRKVVVDKKLEHSRLTVLSNCPPPNRQYIFRPKTDRFVGLYLKTSDGQYSDILDCLKISEHFLGNTLVVNGRILEKNEVCLLTDELVRADRIINNQLADLRFNVRLLEQKIFELTHFPN